MSGWSPIKLENKQSSTGKIKICLDALRTASGIKGVNRKRREITTDSLMGVLGSRQPWSVFVQVWSYQIPFLQDSCSSLERYSHLIQLIFVIIGTCSKAVMGRFCNTRWHSPSPRGFQNFTASFYTQAAIRIQGESKEEGGKGTESITSITTHLYKKICSLTNPVTDLKKAHRNGCQKLSPYGRARNI